MADLKNVLDVRSWGLSGFLWAAFFAAALALFFPALKAYPGSSTAYLLFTLTFNALLLAGFRERRLFFDTFAGVFLWLGFWFKLSAVLVLAGGNFTEPVGEFNFTPTAFDRALYISSLGAAAVLLASFVRQRFFFYSPVIQDEARDVRLTGLYERYRGRIWLAFALLALAIAVGNVYFGIYQRGVPPRAVLPFGLSGLYALALLFGLASFSAVLLDLELRLKRSSFIPPAVALAECFVSNVSMLSRGMILNGAALLVGLGGAARLHGLKLAARYWFWTACVLLGLFIVSFMSTNYMRFYFFNDNKLPSAPKIGDSVRLHPIINRWVGMEGVMSVSAYPGLGRGLWEDAWAESFSDSGTSFYDNRIIKDSPYLRSGVENKHFITLPGIIAFLYYPGSSAFLFCCMTLLALLCAALETFVYRFSGRNLVLTALLAQVMAGRLAHFGYAPARSYMLLGGVLAVVAAVYALRLLSRPAAAVVPIPK